MLKKTLLSLAAFCMAAAAFAQEIARTKHMAVYASYLAIRSPLEVERVLFAPGIRHYYAQNTFLFGCDYSQRWGERWRPYVSLQGALHYVSGFTTVYPSSTLPVGISARQISTSGLAAWQAMLGGGFRYHFVEQERYRFWADLGVFGSQVNGLKAQPNNSVLLPEPDTLFGDVSFFPGGTVAWEVTSVFVPVGRAGIGGEVALAFAPHFALGFEVLYYRSPRFLRVSWSRDLPGTTELATNGIAWGGLRHLGLVARVSYWW